MFTLSKEDSLRFQKIIALEIQRTKVQDHASYCSLARASIDNAEQQPYLFGVSTTTRPVASSPKSIQQRNVDFECSDDSGIVADSLLDSSVPSNSACLYCKISSKNSIKLLPCKVGSDAQQARKQEVLPVSAANWTVRSRTVIFIRMPTNSIGLSIVQVATSRLGVDNLLSNLLHRARNSGLIVHNLPVFFESLCHALRRARIQDQQQQKLTTHPQQQSNCSSADYIPIKEIVTGKECYRPTNTLGKGNFGQVYICEVDRHCSVSRRPKPAGVLALKLTHMNTYRMEQWVHQLLQRGHTEDSYKSTFLLWMSNSLSIELAGQGTGCLLLELATGGSLQELLAGLYSAKRRMLEQEAVFYVAEVACAIDYMHSRGCLHMDIKADNVLLGAGGHVRLADFGNALQLDRLGRARSHLNAGLNTYHLPAEVLRNPPVDRRGVTKGHLVTRATDYFSFGCLVYWLLHQKFPIVPPMNALRTADDYARYMQFEGYQLLAKTFMPASPGYRQLVLDLLHPRPSRRPCGLSRILLLHGDVFANWLLPTGGWRIRSITAAARASELRNLIKSGNLVPPFVPMPMH